MTGRRGITRVSVIAAIGAATFLVLTLHKADLPKWALTVAGTDWLAESVLAVVAGFAAYLAVLVIGMGLVQGEHLRKFGLKELEIEFSEDATDDLRAIDLRLTSDLTEVNGLVKDLAVRVAALEGGGGRRGRRSLLDRLRGK